MKSVKHQGYFQVCDNQFTNYVLIIPFFPSHLRSQTLEQLELQSNHNEYYTVCTNSYLPYIIFLDLFWT